MNEPPLPLLSRSLLDKLRQSSRRGLELPPASLLQAPETVLQIGSGSFLRGFVEDFVQLANAAGDYSGRVVSVQREPDSRSEVFARQDGLYTLILRGTESGRLTETKRIIASISRLLVSSREWEDVLRVGKNPGTRVIITNVTEAGLAPDASDSPAGAPPRGLPGKLTQVLRERWLARGGRNADIAVIPCELVENNGPLVRRLVLEQASAWNLDCAFSSWVETSVHFSSTLVDRIVVGTPQQPLLEAEWQSLGYRDDWVNCAEPFSLFVLEADETTRRYFPIDRAAPGVKFVDDLTAYRVRKLRILNGPHTILAALGRLMGLRTVREAIEDTQLGALITDAIFQEIIPAMDPEHEGENTEYGRAILARFGNPSIEHKLLAICLNCGTKAGIRVFPSVRDYLARRSGLPQRLLLGLAAVMLVLLDPEVRDPHAGYVRERWKSVEAKRRDSVLAFVEDTLKAQQDWSGERIDVAAVGPGVGDWLAEMAATGVRQAIAQRFQPLRSA